MATAAAAPTLPMLPAEKFFRASLLLLIFTSVTTLALTGKLDPITAVLAPIIGRGGVDALFKRSLYLASKSHPWLAQASKGVLTAVEPAGLKTVFAGQSSADAAAGGGLLLQSFHDLLSRLIGSSLTERLLGPILADPSIHRSSQETLS